MLGCHIIRLLLVVFITALAMIVASQLPHEYMQPIRHFMHEFVRHMR